MVAGTNWVFGGTFKAVNNWGLIEVATAQE